MKTPANSNVRNTLIFFAILLLLFFIFMPSKKDIETKEIMFSEFVEAVEKGTIKPPVIIKGSEVFGEYKDGKKFKTRKEDGREISRELDKYKIAYKIEAVADNSSWSTILMVALPTVIMIVIFVMMFRGMNSANKGAMTFGKAKSHIYDPKKDKNKITFADVAGIDEVREKVEEVVDYLRGAKTYAALGGRIPKGILLMGPPGVGKTYIAKAIAGEADVPFLSMSGSEFVEMFVGVGASRVRDLFEQARKSAPCIIFIDEIDAMGKHRGTGIGGGNDEREQTLNQILVEMDGFDPSAGIIMIGATNRPDILDPGLIRPGRFDRKIIVPKPDIAGRKAILAVHTRRKKLDPDVDLEKLARGTPGMTGADLENVANEAALSAGKKKRKTILMDDFEEAVEEVYLGKKMNRKIVEAEKEMTAYHEAGHAIVTMECKHADPLHKVSIEPRSSGALGVTFGLPKDDVYSYSKAKLLEMVLVFLGGRGAEEIVYGKDNVTTGASNDLERATDILRNMVSKWGMDEKFGLGVFDNSHANPFLGKELAMGSGISQGIQEKIEERIRGLFGEYYKKTLEILTAKKDDLKKLAKALLEKETLSVEEVQKLLA